MYLLVCVVDHGVNEGEPVDEQYYEQANEDQYRDPEPEGQYLWHLWCQPNQIQAINITSHTNELRKLK